MDPILQQWLLNLAIDSSIPLRLLPSILDGHDEEPHPLNVQSLRGFTLNYGVGCLAELADNGLIRFTYAPEGGDSRAVDSSEALMLVSRAGIHELSFELTEAGGVAWGKAAEPRWYDMDDGFADPRYENGGLVGWSWTRFSQNREHLMAVLGWFPMLQGGEQLDLGSVTCRLQDDYEVKYWKRLPNVYVATFHTRSAHESLPFWSCGLEPEWFRAWAMARSMWYRHPWDLEGWPPAPEP